MSSHIAFVFVLRPCETIRMMLEGPLIRLKQKRDFFSVWYVSACLMKPRLFENKSEMCFQLK
jgi:hypothetical protein